VRGAEHSRGEEKKETTDHKVLCMDAKFGFDDNADLHQKETFS
jgi:succinyl-CoA synthetase beta subunit